MVFTAFFHHYGFSEECFSHRCDYLHSPNGCDRRKRPVVISKILGCLPILGQCLGIFYIKMGLNHLALRRVNPLPDYAYTDKASFLLSRDNKQVSPEHIIYPYKKGADYEALDISIIVRGVCMLLGLGVLCLLLDIIATLAIFIKKKICFK